MATLNHLPDLWTLAQITQQGFHALKENNAQDFILAINHYAKNLAELGLTAHRWGALGADVIAVIVDSTNMASFLMLCEKNGLTRANRRLFEPFVF